MKNHGLQSIVFPVKDLAAAKALYTTLLGAPHTDQPYYIGFNLNGMEVGLNPNGHATGMTGPVGMWHVDDINAAVAELVSADAQPQQAVTDVGGGTLIAMVRDNDGNPIGLIQNSANTQAR